MTRTIVRRTIAAPVELVFQTVSDIGNFSQAVPDIVKVEFLSDVRSGVGTRFRETRATRGREMSTELEVTEYVENERIRVVSDTHGTVWDTVFTVSPIDGGTQLHMVMDAKAHKLLPKIMNPLTKPFLRKALEADMDAVKTYCER